MLNLNLVLQIDSLCDLIHKKSIERMFTLLLFLSYKII